MYLQMFPKISFKTRTWPPWVMGFHIPRIPRNAQDMTVTAM